MKSALVPAIAALIIVALPARADDHRQNPQQSARSTNDKHGDGGARDAAPGRGHGNAGGNGAGHVDTRGGERLGGSSAGGAAAMSGAVTAGTGRGRNHFGNQMGGTSNAGPATWSATSTFGSRRSRNRGTDQIGTNATIGSMSTRNLSGARAGRQAAVSGLGARPSNWNQYPRQFSSSVYQRNITASRQFHWNSYNRPSGWYYQRWVFGQIFPRIFWGSDYWLSDYWLFDLPIPPYGYEWIRYGDDALLISRSSGRVLQVIYNLFD